MQKFGQVFEKFGFAAEDYEITSCPAAIWAGWELFQKKLNGLLWLPSEEGKKNYPDYDLIFLGSLKQRGYKIRLGKIEGKVEMIAIAPSLEDLEILWKSGLEIIPENKRKNILIEKDLIITAKI